MNTASSTSCTEEWICNPISASIFANIICFSGKLLRHRISPKIKTDGLGHSIAVNRDYEFLRRFTLAHTCVAVDAQCQMQILQYSNGNQRNNIHGFRGKATQNTFRISIRLSCENACLKRSANSSPRMFHAADRGGAHCNNTREQQPQNQEFF